MWIYYCKRIKLSILLIYFSQCYKDGHILFNVNCYILCTKCTVIYVSLHNVTRYDPTQDKAWEGGAEEVQGV